MHLVSLAQAMMCTCMHPFVLHGFPCWAALALHGLLSLQGIRIEKRTPMFLETPHAAFAPDE